MRLELMYWLVVVPIVVCKSEEDEKDGTMKR